MKSGIPGTKLAPNYVELAPNYVELQTVLFIKKDCNSVWRHQSSGVQQDGALKATSDRRKVKLSLSGVEEEEANTAVANVLN